MNSQQDTPINNFYNESSNKIFKLEAADQPIYQLIVEDCMRKLPNVPVGFQVYQTLQNILLKGNKITEQESHIYNIFVKMVN